MSDRPTCGALGLLRAKEVWCIRPPHKHRDHENEAGDRWPSYEGEYDAMLQLTTEDLRKLLASGAQDPVLYVSRDEDTGEPVRVDVWAEALVPHGDIIVRKHELVDALGGPNHPDGVTQDALEHLLEGYQAEIDGMEEAREVPDDVCVDADDNVYPEHDFPPEGEGNDCRRCGAEADDITEPDGIYGGEIR